MSATPRNIRLLVLYWFFVSLRFFSVLQIIYFVKVSGSYTLGASLFAVSSLSQSALEIPTGIYSDTIGRKNTTILAAFCGFISVVLYAIGYNYWFLFLGAVIEGLGRSLGSGNNQALMYDSLKDINKQDELYLHLGKVKTYTSVGYGITALLGGAIATISFPVVMWMSALTQFVGFVITLFLTSPQSYSRSELNPYVHIKESLELFRRSPRLRLLTITRVMKESLGETAYQFTPAFVSTVWPLWAVGALNAAQNGISAFGYFISGRIIRRFKELNTLLGESIFRRITDSIAFAFPSVFSPILLTLNAIVYGAADVSEDSLMHKEFTDTQRATMSSLISLLTSIGFAVGSVGIGVITDSIGISHTLLLSQILLLPIVFIYWSMFRGSKRVGV